MGNSDNRRPLESYDGGYGRVFRVTSRLVPPENLLKHVEGIEEGLRIGRRAGRLGWVGLGAAALQLAVLVLEARSLSDDGEASDWRLLGLAFAFALVLSVSLYLLSRSRMWRRESEEPFRYTCHVSEFEPLGLMTVEGYDEFSVWLKFDLSARLNDRLGRLSFVDESPKTASEQRNRSHIEVQGQYLVRTKGDDHNLEVIPRVQIGGVGAPQTLGHPVRLRLSTPRTAQAEETLHASSADERANSPKGHTIQEDDYAKLLERLYFSVATEIYQQIRNDVQQKIALLPTAFLRATAYLYEAEDYARSNTLHAYDQARVLFDQARQLYDPRLRVLPDHPVQRPRQLVLQRTATLSAFARKVLARVWPRLGKVEMLTARAEIGYARTLLHRRILAGMSGHRMNPIYEAKPSVERAIKRLEDMPREVRGQQEALFDAHVTAALAWSQLESLRRARDSLRKARRVLPVTYEEDARYLYVSGIAEPRHTVAIPILRQAVERDPRFEIAQFELARRTEMNWRTKRLLERTVAELVIHEYEKVLDLNPGNISACVNVGYIRWLLGTEENLCKAREIYLRGLEYKQIQPRTHVAALNYGLARLAAENGDFNDAYRHYMSGVAAQITQGVSDSRLTSSQYHAFDFIGLPMLDRFEVYQNLVRTMWADEGADPVQARHAPPLYSQESLEEIERTRQSRPPLPVHDAVMAFVLNDYGEASHTYSLRHRSTERYDLGRDSYTLAAELDPDVLTPHYNLYLLELYEDRFESALGHLRRVQDLAPTWPEGILAKLAAYVEWANDRALEVAPPPSVRNGRGQQGRPGPPLDLPDEVEKTTERVLSREIAVDELEALLPHGWLWRSHKQRKLDFNWGVASDRKVHRARKWERELDDVNVRCLFLWDIAHLLSGKSSERGLLGTLPARHGYSEGAAKALLKHIRYELWPANLRVLLTWWQLFGMEDEDAEDEIRCLVDSWLETDPTSHWALKLMLHVQRLGVLDDAAARRYLQNAKHQLGDEEVDLAGWIDEQLKLLSVAA